MVKTIKIFDNLRLFNLILNLRDKSKILYLKKSSTVSFLSFFFQLKKYEKLNWNLIDNITDGKKIITSIIENKEVDNFVYDFVEDIKKKIKIEKNFLHYLVKYLSNNKNLIGEMSIENFIVFYKSSNFLYKDYEIIFHLERSEFDQIIKKKFQNKRNTFNFYSNLSKIYIFKRFSFLIKGLIYLFKTRDYKNYNNKSICFMDSYEINNPKFFLSNQYIYDQTLAIKYKSKEIGNEVIDINHYITIKNYLSLILNILRNYNFFQENQLISYLNIIFNYEKNIFLTFFKKNNIKIFLSSFIVQPYVSSAVAAIEQLNGRSIGYTMSYIEDYSSHLNIDAFNYFFSFNNKKYKKLNNSNLLEIFSLGYISDYKFKEKKKSSIELREKLLKTGAKYIIGFYDQGSSDDSMFEIGHDRSRTGYEFLLKKIIDDKNFALIIKPKKPAMLKNKLGKIYDLLIKAKETKRCIVFDNASIHGIKNFEDIPAKIAMASDLTIHDTLLAGTAGLESALTGTKSIFFDYYNATKSQFDKEDLKIVFRDWNYLWNEIIKDFEFGNDILGNWKDIIDNFDKFRDGKTNIRIMEFLKKVIEEINNERSNKKIH